jgi:hypothetical protein
VQKKHIDIHSSVELPPNFYFTNFTTPLYLRPPLFIPRTAPENIWKNGNYLCSGLRMPQAYIHKQGCCVDLTRSPRALIWCFDQRERGIHQDVCGRRNSVYITHPTSLLNTREKHSFFYRFWSMRSLELMDFNYGQEQPQLRRIDEFSKEVTTHQVR